MLRISWKCWDKLKMHWGQKHVESSFTPQWKPGALLWSVWSSRFSLCLSLTFMTAHPTLSPCLRWDVDQNWRCFFFASQPAHVSFFRRRTLNFREGKTQSHDLQRVPSHLQWKNWLKTLFHRFLSFSLTIFPLLLNNVVSLPLHWGLSGGDWRPDMRNSSASYLTRKPTGQTDITHSHQSDDDNFINVSH